MADDHEHLFPPEPEPRRRTPAGQALAVVLVALLAGDSLMGWIGPSLVKAFIEQTWPDMEQGVKAEIAARPWAHFVDTRSTLTPNGRYTAYLPDQSGKQVKVRENDGVHSTPRGAEFEVAPLAKALRKERNLR